MKQHRTATLNDAIAVSRLLRDDDRREVEGLGYTAKDVMYMPLFSEHPTYFFTKDGTPAGVSGVVREGAFGKIWMLCTDAIHQEPIRFVREAKSWIKSIEKDYSLLYNVVDTRNKVHHKLLKHLGFKALSVQHVGPMNLPYYEIVRLCAYQQ